MNFATWWVDKTPELKLIFQDPYKRCQFEIMQRVEQVAKEAYEAGQNTTPEIDLATAEGALEDYRAGKHQTIDEILNEL